MNHTSLLRPSILRLCAPLVALALSITASAAPFSNGGFEQPGIASGTEQALPDRSTAVAGWTANKGVFNVWNAAIEFSTLGNSGFWEYGYRTSLAGGFTLFDTLTNRGTAASFWTDAASGGTPNVVKNGTAGALAPFAEYTLQSGQLAQEPVAGKFSVIRFQNFSETATYEVSVEWVGLNAATSTDVHVLLNGSAIYNGTVTGTGTASWTNAGNPNTLPPGIPFEFVVGDGGDASAANVDMTGVKITIKSLAGDPGMAWVKDAAVPGPVSAFDGAHRVSFGRNGGRSGTLSQTFDTVPGVTYEVNYALTTEGADDDGQSMKIWAFDGDTPFAAALLSNIPATQGQWLQGDPYVITAVSTSTRIGFYDTTPSNRGTNASWALDGVSLRVVVPGTANIWLAGQAGGVARNSDTSANAAPVEMPLALVAGQDVTFDVIGGVQHNGPGGPGSPLPDGDTATTHLAENSVPELKAPIDSLVGVFLDGNPPSGSPGTYLDFTVATNRELRSIEPGLGQPFFIGDGRTTAGAVQRVRIPTGATRLFLGALDEYDNFDNGGYFTVIANVVAPQPPLTTPTFDEIVNGNYGEPWTFTATLASNAAGLFLRVQSSLTPGNEASWSDLPGGGQMTRSGDTWTLETSTIPLGARFFRVVAAATDFTDSKVQFATSFNVESPAGKILYSSGALVGSRDLALMEFDGSGKMAITAGTRSIQGSALSPDGTKVAFVTFSGDLFVMKAAPEDSVTNPAIDVLDLSGVTANGFSTPAWSPDGTRLVFAGDDTHLYVIEAIDESGEIQPYDVATNPLVDVGINFSSAPNPAWSPDGRHLALVGGNYVEVFQITDASGALTPQSTSNFSIPLTHQSDFASAKIFASWSPDGTQIAFVERSVADSTQSRVSVLNARMPDGTLTPETEAGGANRRVELHAFTSTPAVETVSWSPDGALLALGVSESGEYHIETIEPAAINGTNPRVPLTTFAADGHSFQPSFKQSVIVPEPMQLVAFESTNYAGNEAGTPIILKVLRTGGSAGELTVDFTVAGGTAVVDEDFSLSEGPLVFADGETEKTITVTPINDGTGGEGDETITLELEQPDAGDLGAIATATVTIHDNETGLDPFVGAAEEFTVAINGKVKKKGKGKTSDLWSFKVRQVADSQLPALGVTIQTTATPADPASWVNLPEGALHRANATSFTWVGSTRRVPTGKVYFRTLSLADAHRSNTGPVVGPFTIVPAAVLDMSVRVVTDSDTSGATVKPGEFITYTLKLKNSGTATAKKVVMNSRLPQKTRFDSASNAAAGGTFHQDLDRKGVITDVFWTVGDLAPGATVTEFVTVQVDQTLPFEWIIQNDRLTSKASGFKEAFLPTFRTDVTAPIRITVAKDKSIVVAGDLITYTLTITNDASFTVTGGKVNDQIPTGTRLVSYANGSGNGNYLGTNSNATDLSATPNALSQPGFTPHNGMLTWNVGDIESGGSRQLRFTVRVAYDLFEKLARNGESFNVQLQNLNFDFLATPPSGGVIAARGGVIPTSEIARTFVSAEPPTLRPELGLKKEAMSDTRAKLGDLDIAAVFDDGNREIVYEISAWNYGTIAATDTVITDDIPFETELFLDDPLVYNFDAFMARFVLNGTPVSSPAGFHFFDAAGNSLAAGGEPFTDQNGNGKIDKGEYIDQNSNSKYDGPGAIRRFTYDYGALPPMTDPQEKTLTYRVRLTPKVKRGEYITAFNSARAPRGEGLQLTCPDFLYPLIGQPDELYTRVVKRVEHVVEQPVANIDQIIADDPATHTVIYTLRFTNTGDFIATDTKLRVPIPGGFTTTSTTVEKRNGKLDLLPNSTGTAVFDIGPVGPGETITRQLALSLVTPVPRSLFGKNGQLKLQSVPVFPLAYSTLATAPSAARAVRTGLPSPTFTLKLPAAGSNGVATPIRLNKTGARVFIGRVAPFSVLAGNEMTMSIFCGNHGDTDANNGEVAIQIPYGTQLIETGFWTNSTSSGYIKTEKLESSSRRPQDGRVETVVWKFSRLAAHDTAEMDIRLRVNEDFDGAAFTEKSCTVKFSDASGRTAAPLTVQVRHGSNGEVNVWQAIGSFVAGFGEVLDSALRSLFGDHSKQVSLKSSVISLAGTDYVQITSGAVIMPLGGGRSAVIHELQELDAPFQSRRFHNAISDDNIIVMAVGASTQQSLFVPGTILAPRTVDIILEQLTDPVAGIVAAGGGNIVAAGGGNVVANDGAGIVAGGGLNFGAPGSVAKVVANDGAGVTLGTINFTSLTRPGIVAGGGGNIVAAGGGNIVAAGGGNIVAAGGGNIVAGGGGNLVPFDGKLILADQMTTLMTKLPAIEGANLIDIKIGGRDGLPEDSPILFNAAPIIGQDGASLVGQDGASLVGQDGASFR